MKLPFRKKKPARREVRMPANQSRRVATNNYYRPKNTPVRTESVQKTGSETRKKITLSQVVNGAILLSIIAIVIFSTTLSSQPDVNIRDNGFSYRADAVYEEKAADILAENILQRSKLLFRSTDFEQTMQEAFPEAEQIDAILPLGGRNLSVTMSVSQPLGVIKNGSDSGILTENGVLATTSLPDDTTALMRVQFATPQSGFAVGARLLTSQEVALLSTLEAEMSALILQDTNGLVVSDVLFNVAEGQFEVRFSNAPYFARLSAYGDSAEQIGALKATLAQLDREGSLPASYIDVRVPGRVFVL